MFLWIVRWILQAEKIKEMVLRPQNFKLLEKNIYKSKIYSLLEVEIKILN